MLPYIGQKFLFHTGKEWLIKGHFSHSLITLDMSKQNRNYAVVSPLPQSCYRELLVLGCSSYRSTRHRAVTEDMVYHLIDIHVVYRPKVDNHDPQLRY